jgi:hypothetical protein
MNIIDNGRVMRSKITRLGIFIGVGLLALYLRPQQQPEPTMETSVVENVSIQPKVDYSLERKPRLNKRLISHLIKSHAPESPQEIPGLVDSGQDWSPMHIFAYVANEDGSIPEAGVIHSQSCSIYQPIGPDGYVELELTESCDLFASRKDGLFMAFSVEDWIEFEPGIELDIELELPTYRIGGLGLSIMKVDEGFLVQYIFPGTPGEQIGLKNGDVIVEIDGFDASTLMLYDFIQIATGEEGTTSTLRLKGDSYDDPPREYIRARLDG